MPAGFPTDSFPARVLEIDRDATRVLPDGALTVQAGGPLLAREADGRYFPERSVYRVKFSIDGLPERFRSQTWRGVLSVEATPEPYLSRWLRSAAAVLWREAGF